jgi:hypothetical protein
MIGTKPTDEELRKIIVRMKPANLRDQALVLLGSL